MATIEVINALATLCYWGELKNDEDAFNRLISFQIIDDEDVEIIVDKKNEIERREDAANVRYDFLRNEGHFDKRF